MIVANHPWVERHRRFLAVVDKWFSAVRDSHAGHLQCGRGCALCCYGLFDISFPDALMVADALDILGKDARQAVTDRAAEIQQIIRNEAPDLSPPFLLDQLSEQRLDQIVDRARSPRCPLLGMENECLIYPDRLLACRLEGVPMVDTRDGLFGDWCELNFTGGLPQEAVRDFERDYHEMQQAEDGLTESLTQCFLGRKLRRATVFIPSLIVEF